VPTKFWISTSSTSFSTAANWSDGNAPANSDTLIFNGVGTAAVSTDLSTVLTGVTLIVEPAYTGNIGLVSGATQNYLTLDGGTLRMPLSQSGSRNSGSQKIMVAFGTTAATVIIEETNTTGAETNYPPVQVKGTVITATVTGNSYVGFAVRPSDVATLASLRISAGAGGTPNVWLGSGVTITDCVLEAGNVFSYVAQTCTAMRIGGATVNVMSGASGAHTTINLDAGALYYSGTGTITTLNIRSALCDFSRDPRAKTVTTATTNKGAVLNVDTGVPGSIIFTNAVNHNDGLGPNGAQLITPAFVKGTLVTQ
jgi:hypothetical protein